MLDNVKSKYILKEIFDIIKNKRKLKIIKYNKKIKIKLDINKGDFEKYIALKEFNKKYDINIEDIDLKVLMLNWRNIRNMDLKDLVIINFKKLEILDLSGNKISNINILEKVNFKELKKLNLSYTEVSDIEILVKVNFNELQKLDLSGNKISTLNSFEKVNFKELKEFNISFTQISDINVLEKS